MGKGSEAEWPRASDLNVTARHSVFISLLKWKNTHFGAVPCHINLPQSIRVVETTHYMWRIDCAALFARLPNVWAVTQPSSKN